jgi:hypothetical protein
MTFHEDEMPCSREALRELEETRLVRYDSGSGWSASEAIELTRAGRIHFGLPVPPTVWDKVRAWLPRTKYPQ